MNTKETFEDFKSKLDQSELAKLPELSKKLMFGTNEAVWNYQQAKIDCLDDFINDIFSDSVGDCDSAWLVTRIADFRKAQEDFQTPKLTLL